MNTNLFSRLFMITMLCIPSMPAACMTIDSIIAMNIDPSDTKKLEEAWDNLVLPEKFQVANSWDTPLKVSTPENTNKFEFAIALSDNLDPLFLGLFYHYLGRMILADHITGHVQHDQIQAEGKNILKITTDEITDITVLQKLIDDFLIVSESEIDQFPPLTGSATPAQETIKGVK